MQTHFTPDTSRLYADFPWIVVDRNAEAFRSPLAAKTTSFDILSTAHF